MRPLLLLLTVFIVNVFGIDQPNVKNAFIQYSAELYTEVSKENAGSFVICPPSIQTGLGLIYSGATGNSAKEISNSFHLPENPKEFQEIIHHLSNNFKSTTDDYTLNSANKVYINHDFQISKEYKNTLVNVYDADIENIDFSKKTSAAAEINKWIENKTHHKIKNMVSEDQMEDVRAALVNAMYFQGKWVHEFNSKLTTSKPFYVDSKTEKSIDMMHMSGHYNYYESPELRAQFLELPYKGENITMTFVLPLDKFGLSALESHINKVVFTPKFSKERVIMAIPKYKIDTSVNLVPVLSRLGVHSIFSNNAELTGMTENKEPVKIGAALQKAVIEVDEKGTIATAAFVGFITPLSASYVPPPTYYFTADHPFIYYIKINDVVMFIGRYAS